jgi:hypothetical protein
MQFALLVLKNPVNISEKLNNFQATGVTRLILIDQHRGGQD